MGGRFWTLCAGLALGFALFATAALAQSAGPQHPDDRPDPAPADTTRYPTLFDRIGLHPELNSRFDVNRTATTFRQGANIRKHFGPTLVSSNWDVSVQRNSTQNDRRQVAGLSKTRVARHGEGQGGWRFGSDFGLSRKSVTTTFTRNVINDTTVDLGGGTGILGHLTQERLGLGDGTVDWKLDGKFGAVRKESVNERFNRLDPTRLDNADSTRAGGATWSLVSDLTVVPAEQWVVDLSGGIDQGRQGYDTLLRPTADSTAVQEGTNRDGSRDLDFSASWRPTRGNEVRVLGSWDVATSQYYSTTQKAQETTNGHSRNLQVFALAEPFWGITTEVKAGTNTTVSRFALSEGGASQEGHTFEGRAGFKLGRGFRWLHGFSVALEGKTGSTSTFYQDATPGFDEEIVYMKGTLQRTWHRGTSATLSATGDLSQKYYEELDDGSRQDSDRLKQRVDFGLSYQLTPSVTTLVSVNWAKTSTINILADRAALNVDENSISTGGKYVWTLWNGTALSQDLILNAASATRPYNENESSLRRTTSLRSKLESPLTEHVQLDLEHYFQFQDQGAFLIDASDRIRRFLRDTETVTQRTDVHVRYSVRPGFGFYLRQKFEVRGSKNLISGSVNQRPTTEIRWGGEFRHDLDADFSVNLGFERISSTVENSYWTGTAQVSRLF